MTTVALLGTRIMGAGMGHNLLRSGLDLRVWNRTATRAQPLADAGAVLAADPAEAVAGADVVVTVLGDGRHAHDVVASARPRPGTVWAQMTTAGVDRALPALAERLGLRFVDAPVVGTRQPAESGQLLVLAAGAPDVRAAVAPVFDAVGRETRWVGDDGAGLAASRLKLVVNSWVLAVTAAAGEAVALAEALDVDPRAFLDTVAGGPLDLPYLRAKADAVLARDWTPNFSTANAAKDADLIVAAGEEAGVALDVAAAAGARYRRVADAGHADDDMAAAYLASRLPG
jgi:3-hydroxyisobutyrate dehydrogenase